MVYNEQKGVYERSKTPNILNEDKLSDEDKIEVLAYVGANLDFILKKMLDIFISCTCLMVH